MSGVAITRTTILALAVVGSFVFAGVELRASIVTSVPRGVSSAELRDLDAQLANANLRRLGGTGRAERVARPSRPDVDTPRVLRILLAECRASQPGSSMDPSGQSRAGASPGAMLLVASLSPTGVNECRTSLPEESSLLWDDADPSDLLRPPECSRASFMG